MFLLRLVLRNAFRHRLRTVLTLAGLAFIVEAASLIRQNRIAQIPRAFFAWVVIPAIPVAAAIQITIRRLVAPSGAVINKQGVQPDVEADLTRDDLQRGDDPQRLRAVELLANGPLQGAPAPSPGPSPSPTR